MLLKCLTLIFVASFTPHIKKLLIKRVGVPNFKLLTTFFVLLLSLGFFLVWSRKDLLTLPQTVASWDGLSCLGVAVLMTIPSLLFLYLLEDHGASVLVLLISPLSLITIAMVGYLLFGENLTRQQMMGTGIIILGVCVFTFNRDKLGAFLGTCHLRGSKKSLPQE